jgi:CRISPR-associated endoribonuclease Cas6
MRIRIEVQSALGKFILPQGYNPYVQGLVNACIPEDIKWSGIATGTEEAHFKLFTFSQLYAKSVERIDVAPRENADGEARVQYQLVFSSPVWFYLSSPSPEFIEALSPRLEKAHDLHLERNLVQSVRVGAARVPALPTHGVTTWRIRTISPITAYQSESKDSNSARYFAPEDPLFSKIILDNAVRKYYAWIQEKAPSDGFAITCLDHTPHLAIVNFKDTPVRGYTGRFQLTGDAKLLSFLYESGLGGKNSHGFGMFDIVPEGEDSAHWRRRTEEGTHEVRKASSNLPEAGERAQSEHHGPADSRDKGEHVWHGEHHGPAGEHGPSRHTDSTSRPQSRAEHPDRPRSDRPSEGRPQTESSTSDRFHSDRSYSARPRPEGHRSEGAQGPNRGTGLPGQDDRRFKSSSRDDSPVRRGPRGTEEPHRKFVSRYAPDIKPVSHEKAATGSYSIWDGKAKTELPRFVRPDGTESTGGPRPMEHHGGPRTGSSGRPTGESGRPEGDRNGRSFGRSAPSRGTGSSRRSGGGPRNPHDQRGNRGH